MNTKYLEIIKAPVITEKSQMAKENGQYIQIAISLTCPKTPVENFGSMDFGNNELNFEDGATIQPVKKATEISPEEEENLRALIEKLGL